MKSPIAHFKYPFDSGSGAGAGAAGAGIMAGTGAISIYTLITI
jgi:hypothetical protein